MPALFMWPPLVTTYASSTGSAYFYADNNGGNSIPLPFTGPVFAGDAYRVCAQDRYFNEGQLFSHAQVFPDNAVFSPSGAATTGVETGGLTSTDGVSLQGGAFDAGEDFRHGIAPDFDNIVWVWGTVITTNSANRGFMGISGSRYANTPTIPLNSARGAHRGSSTQYFCFFLSGGNTRYVTFDSGTGDFGNSTQIFGNSDELFYMMDAGEGYYYAFVKNGSTLKVFGVDLSGGSPSVTADLGPGTWTDTPLRTGCYRYIVINGNRFIAIKTTSGVITLTFTSGTKATPTVSRTEDGLTGSYFTVEYDPGSTDRAYVVLGTIVEQHPQLIKGRYADLLNLGAGFSAEITIASISNGGSLSGLRAYGFSSAQQGEAYRSVAISSVFQTFGDVVVASAAFQFWHVPVEFERDVDIGTTTSVGPISFTVSGPRYVEIESNYTSVSAGVAINGAHSDHFQWSISNSSEYTSGVEITTTYTSVSLTGQVVVIVETLPLQQYWTNMGRSWMDDFMVYLNQDRAAVGMPPYKTWGVDGKFVDRQDIAVFHADQMSRTRIFQHEDPAFYPNWQTVSQRNGNMAAVAGSENLLISATLDLTDGFLFGHITPFDAWQNWHDSPGHYSNMVFNWGALNSKVYSVMAASEGWYPAAFTDQYIGTYLCNNFVALEALMFESNLQQFWDNTGSLIATLPQRWSNAAWTPVSQQNSTPWALRLAVELEAGWGCRVAAEHIASWSFSVRVDTEFPYVGTLPVTKVEHEAGFDIYATEPVSLWHESGWGLSVAAQSEAPFALLETVSLWHEAGYTIYDTEPVSQWSEHPYGLSVSLEAAFPYSMYGSVRQQNEARYGDVVIVRTEQQADYALLLSNPVAVTMAHYYSMQDYTSILPATNQVKLILPSGASFVVDDGVIDSAENDIGYNFECSISDLNIFTQINEDDPIIVDFCGELYDFFITTKSMTRNGPTEISFRLAATNAVVRTGSPYAQETDYVQEANSLASDLVDALIEINFNYEIVDWLILSGRLQVAGATSLEAVQQIAEAAGGVVDGDIDGTMRIRYPYPVPMNALDAVVVDQSYSDDYDNLSVSVQTQYRDGANKFRIREGDASFADSLEWIPDDPQTDTQYQTGLVKAFLSPYRTTASIVHLGNAVSVQQLGEQEELNEELVEFNEGVGNTRRPIHQLLSLEWITADMGGATFTPYSTLLNVGLNVNNGYGLAKVTYNAKHLTARAAGVPAFVESGKVGPASSYAYFVLEESNG